MKTTTFLTKSFLLALTAGILVTGCKKKEDDDKDTAAAGDNAFAEASFNDAATISDQAAQSGSLTSYKMGEDEASLLSTCATITFKNAVSNSTNQDTIIVDFGTTNCVCSDGRSRRGQVIVYYTGRYKNPGSTHTITFNNYYVNDNKIDGSKTVANNGFNTAGHLTWAVSVNGTITLASGGGTVTWTSTRTRELLGTLGSAMLNTADTTINWASSKWGITGSASGTSAKGVNYTASITSQIVFDMTCTANRRHPTQGAFDFTPQGKATRTVDFGSGACDDAATVTIKGKTYNITLK